MCVCVGEGTGKGWWEHVFVAEGVNRGVCVGVLRTIDLVVELVCPMQGRPRSCRHLEYAGISAVRFLLLFCFCRLLTQFFCPCHKKFKNSL